MRVCLFEDEQVAFLEPLALTRPAFELRCGAWTLGQRQCCTFGATQMAAIVRPHLASLCKAAHPDFHVNDIEWLTTDATTFVNARWLPTLELLGDQKTEQAAFVGGQLAYAVLSPKRLPTASRDNFIERLKSAITGLPRAAAGGWMIDYPWDLVEYNAAALKNDFAKVGANGAWQSRAHGITVIGLPEQLFIHAKAVVEPMVVADTTRGPVAIDRDAVVQAFSRLEGPCHIGPGSWIIGAKLRSSTIGPMCRIGGEVEATIVHGYSNKYHDGFLGHSYVGEWVNLAAGTQVSDLRNDYGNVTVTINGKRIDTKLSKVGTFIGDHTKTGLGALFNTGTAVGAFCNLLPAGELMPRAIPSFCKYSRGRIEIRSDWRDLLTTVQSVMQRRGREFGDADKELINSLYHLTETQRRQARR